MKRAVLGLSLMSALMCGPASGQSVKDAAIGTWNLVGYVSTAADGTKTENFGPAPIGIATFDAVGNFTITIVRADIPAFAANNREQGTAEENRAVVRGSIAYFGTYTLAPSGNELIFKIAGATLPNWKGTTQKRGIAMSSKNDLTLVNPVASGGGSAEVTWKRAGGP